MKFSNRSLTHSAQWQAYRQLELIPDSVPNPAEQTHYLAAGLNPFWRKLLALLIDELVEEQRVEYLDRCWSLTEYDLKEQAASSTLQRLWFLIN
jgi:hypothetical protein